jgi:hypothetical protein
MSLKWHPTFGEEINEQRYRSHNFKREVQKQRRFDSTDFFDFERHAIRLYTIAISSKASI